MRFKAQANRQRGDTIVEVLIAIAVISLVLAGAYVTTNRNLLATRAAQERGNALTLAESQLEQIKSLAVSDPDVLFGAGTPSPFCVTSALSVASASDAACRMDSTGAPTATEPVYSVSVTRDSPDGNGGYLFTVTNRWVDPSGRRTDEVRLTYRVYE